MTAPRTPLHPSSASQLQGQYGVVAGLAREHDIRRQQVYDLRERGRMAFEVEFTSTLQTKLSQPWVCMNEGFMPLS